MMTPQTKRYRNDQGTMGRGLKGEENDSYLTNEIFLPTEMDKLKKLFPLLDNDVRIPIFS